MLRNPNYVYGPRISYVPAHLNFGTYILDKMWEFREKDALINGATDEHLTYGDIIQQATNFSLSLTRMGVRKGDTIALFSENRKEYWGAVIGVACAGAVLTAISTSYVKGEITHVMNISKPKYIIVSETMYKMHSKTLKSLKFIKNIIIFGDERVGNVLSYNDMTFEKNGVIKNVKYEDFDAVKVEGQNDTLFIMYSSGTTGLPKGVMLTHLNVLTSVCIPVNQVPGFDPVYLNITPWYHVMGLVATLTAFSNSRTGVFLARFELDTYLKTIEKYKPFALSVVPPILVAISKIQPKYDLSSVFLIFSGAAPLHKDTIKAVHEKFPNLQAVFQGYGSTEVTLAVTRFSGIGMEHYRVGSVGTVSPNTIIKVVDIETRKPLGPNQQGEICAKGDLLMKGYIGKEMRDDFDEEGFYKTGDVGYYDDDGHFFIVDRLKELIKYKAYQVPPAELEAVLLQHSDIKEAAVIGIPHKEAGEVPLAFVVVQPGKSPSEDEIKDFVAQRLSNPKHLRGGVRFIDQIPKSLSGKLLRKELRKLVNSSKSKL